MLFALSTRYWMYSLKRYANALRLTVGTFAWGRGTQGTQGRGDAGEARVYVQGQIRALAMSMQSKKLTSALFFVSGRSTMGKE